ncbi:hypothetical protein [Pseudomonas graminis]|uniref:hypothetical protein n=1 Tax=Pseudomonas graminis TaxID=158627 RepID=UPI00105ED347|nr:hypothetical protein [Pseudomonas graminis]
MTAGDMSERCAHGRQNCREAAIPKQSPGDVQRAEQIGHTRAGASGMVRLILENTKIASNGVMANRDDFQIDTLIRKILPEFAQASAPDTPSVDPSSA